MLNRYLATPALLALSLILPVHARSVDQDYQGANPYGVETLDERVAKLEKRLSGEVFMDMSNRLDQLQNDFQRLHGQVEELNHELESLKQRQKDMYMDLYQRLQAPGGQQAPTSDQAAEPPDTGSQQQVDVSPPPAAPPVAPPPRPVAPAPSEPSDTASRKAAYDKGFNLLNNGKYPESVKEFKKFLSAYPTGEYSDNAAYWMGESYYVMRDFPSSREAFRKLIREFPQSPKAADAKLKLGYIDYYTNQWSNARNTLNDVIKSYPGTTAAQQAAKRLAKMKQEGH